MATVSDDDIRQKIAAYRKETLEMLDAALNGNAIFYNADKQPSETPTGQAILNASREEQARTVVELFDRKRLSDDIKKLVAANGEYAIAERRQSVTYVSLPSGRIATCGNAVLVLRNQLLRRKLPFTADQICVLANHLTFHSFFLLGGSGNLILGAIERFAEDEALPSDAVANLQRLRGDFSVSRFSSEDQQLLKRINSLLGIETPILEPGEAWSDAALADLKSMKEDEVAAWRTLLEHCQTASAGKPSKKWLATAAKLREPIGDDQFRERMTAWLPLVDRPRTQPLPERGGYLDYTPESDLVIIDRHADILKGLAWCCSQFDDAEIARALTALAISAYKKVPGIGPRLVKVGNACVYSLGAMPGDAGVGQLALLKVRVKFGTAQKGIDKALQATAERLGIAREEVEEMAVPAYGLTDVGLRTATLGDFTAELRVAGRKTALHWIKPDGKEQKSVPATAKRDFGEELAELKRAGKDIEKMLPAQAARIEQTYLSQQEWKLPLWRERYLDHPLVGTLARRLIWRFERGKNHIAAIFSDDGFVDHRNKAVDWPDGETTVRLWHPLDERNTETVLAWRAWLMEHEVQQPFKQAHREIYVLTDAERNTGIYSNRFAAHVLKQHQFNALCGARNWKNRLRLMVDDEYPPAHVDLPAWNLRAEFWVEGIGEDITEAGTHLYLATDQVRFYHRDAAINSAHAGGGGYASTGTDRDENNPLDLESIPPLVFSEVMRDVDLFVGVASVGNDPLWADGGLEGRFRDYWQSFSFGELGATAGTRKAVLEKLIPRLKIADRCSFSDRFLIVQGNIRTYKIHLGSGNILMEPNDEYLCIVPKQFLGKGSDGSVFLPFEGDRTMSIILSKALMLADDKKIKDRTIVSQISRR